VRFRFYRARRGIVARHRQQRRRRPPLQRRRQPHSVAALPQQLGGAVVQGQRLRRVPAQQRQVRHPLLLPRAAALLHRPATALRL